MSFRPSGVAGIENSLRARLRQLKENIKESRCPKSWEDASSGPGQKSFVMSSASPASQSASLNKAFVQSGSLGMSNGPPAENVKSGGNSKLSVSQQKSLAPLSESQMRQYFGSNHNQLSITQREKIVYAIINRSANFEAGSDVKIEDVLDVSKAGSNRTGPGPAENVQPKSIKELLVMDDSMNCFPKDLSPVFSSGEPRPIATPQTNEPQRDQSDARVQQSSLVESVTETPGKSSAFPECVENTENKKKVDDTLEISFRENINEGGADVPTINEGGDTLKDLEQLNEAMSSGKGNEQPAAMAVPAVQAPASIDSLELSAIAPAQPALDCSAINQSVVKERLFDDLEDSSHDNGKSAHKETEEKARAWGQHSRTFIDVLRALKGADRGEEKKNRSLHLPRGSDSVPRGAVQPLPLINIRPAPAATERVEKPDNNNSPIKIATPEKEEAKAASVRTMVIKAMHHSARSNEQDAGGQKRLFVRLAGKKVLLLKKRPEHVNQTLDCIPADTSSAELPQNVTTVADSSRLGPDPRSVRLKLVRRDQIRAVTPHGKPGSAINLSNIVVSTVHTATRNAKAEGKATGKGVNKSMSEIPTSTPSSSAAIRIVLPQKQHVRFNAFSLKTRPESCSAANKSLCPAEESKTSAKNIPAAVTLAKEAKSELQQTPEFSSKGESTVAQHSGDRLRALNSAITRADQRTKEVSPFPLTSQNPTDYNSVPMGSNIRKTEVVLNPVRTRETGSKSAGPTRRIVKRIKSVKVAPTAGSKADSRKGTVSMKAVGQQAEKLTESPHVAFYRRKKYGKREVRKGDNDN